MLKDNVITVCFFLVIGLLHFGVCQLYPQLYFGNEIILSYVVLFLLNFIGTTIFYTGKKRLKDVGFPQLFMIFSTVQFLGSLIFVAYISFTNKVNAKAILIQFVILFFITLIFQSIYFVKTKIKEE